MSFNLERFELYLNFVQERHRVWWRRQAGATGPWSDDPILASRKFTNVFRVLDPGSQFIFELETDSPEDTLMRLFLYRHTGRVEAWRFLREALGGYPTVDSLADVHEVLRGYREAGRPVFTGAYLVYPGSSTPGTDKLESIIGLTSRLFATKDSIVPDFLKATTQAERFGVLRRNHGVADFMSMQILTDWGYTDLGGDVENEFVVPGPGCRKGISTITNTPHQTAFLAFAQQELLAGRACPTLNLDPNGGLRYPSIMDVQNTMCEFSKYTRYLEAGKVSKPYSPAHPGQQASPILPGHWA